MGDWPTVVCPACPEQPLGLCWVSWSTGALLVGDRSLAEPCCYVKSRGWWRNWSPLLPSYGLFPVSAILGVFLSTSLTTCLVKIRVMRAVEIWFLSCILRVQNELKTSQIEGYKTIGFDGNLDACKRKLFKELIWHPRVLKWIVWFKNYLRSV